MDKFHKPRTHRDKSKYDRKSESEKLQDELEPIPEKREGPVVHPTEYDESDDLEDAKRVIPPQPEKAFQPFNGGKGG